MRPIDADALKEKKVYSRERRENVVPVCEIDWQPTIDAVEVVRCKECRGSYMTDCDSNNESGLYCGWWNNRKTHKYGFCHMGEREEVQDDGV